MRRRGWMVALGLVGALLALGVVFVGLRPPERETVTVVGSPAEAAVPVALAPAGVPAEPRSAVGARTGTCRIVGLARRAGKPVAAKVEVRRTVDVDRIEGAEEAPLDPGPGAVTASGAVLARAHSGGDGRFSCPGLPIGAYLVRGSTEEGARGAVVQTLRVDGQAADVVLDLMAPSASLRGTVVREDGTAVVGRVRLRPDVPPHRGWGPDEEDEGDRGAPSADPRDASTDASGTFKAAGMTPGRYKLEVQDGDTRATVSVWIPRPEGIRVVLPSRWDAAEGTVAERATGAVIGGATIAWRAWSGGGTLERTLLTDTSGHFPFPRAPGTWLMIRAPGFAPRSVSIPREGPIEIRFLLDRTVRIRGRATFADDGRAAVGLVVEASSAPASRGFTRPHARTITDADGRYLMEGLSPGEVSVRVHDLRGIARGMADLSLEDLEHPLDYDPLSVPVAPGGDGTLDLTIDPPARIVGRLTDASGAPVVGVLVTASRPGRGYLHAHTPPSYWRIGRAVTGDDGRFTLGDLLPGWTYDVVAVRGAEAASTSATASTNPTPSALALSFGPAGTFEARVVDDATGTGVAGVDLHATTARVWGASWRGRTGEDGMARIGPLASGDVEVQSGDTSTWILEPETVTVPLAEQRALAPLELRIRRATIETEARLGAAVPRSETWVNGRQVSGGSGTSNPLTVRVVDANGAAVPRADLDWHLRVNGSGTGGSVPVIDGVATVPRSVDPVVSAWVSVSRPRRADDAPLPLGTGRAGPIADATGSIELRLPAVPWVEGRVVDEGGRGVSGLRLRLVVPGTESSGAWDDDGPVNRTDATGRFRLVGLGDDEQCLIVLVPDRFACVSPVPAGREGTRIEIRLRAAVAARITITGPEGAPATGVEVRAWDFRTTMRGISNLDWTPRSASATTDARGIATLEGLDPEGTYALHVKTGARSESEREWQRSDWSPADTAFKLRDERSIRGLVRDPRGRPVPGARVVGFVGHRWIADTITAADGTFVLGDDQQDGFALYATLCNGRGPVSDVVVPGENGEDVALTLAPGLELRVHLRGELVATRMVLLLSDADEDWAGPSDYQHEWTDEQGRVSFRGLRPGVGYAVWVAPSTATQYPVTAGADDSTALLREQRAGTPAAEVEVRMEPGLVLAARAPAGTTLQAPSIHARHGRMEVEGTQRPDGAFEFRGLVDEEWYVVVEARGGGQRYVGRGRPGADVSLEREASPGGR